MLGNDGRWGTHGPHLQPLWWEVAVTFPSIHHTLALASGGNPALLASERATDNQDPFLTFLDTRSGPSEGRRLDWESSRTGGSGKPSVAATWPQLSLLS